MAGVKITNLPAVVHLDPTNLLPQVDMIISPSPQTQKMTFAQLITFLQQNMALVYQCVSNPNSEAIAAFNGSICLATSTGGVWQQQGAGYGATGWVQFIA